MTQDKVTIQEAARIANISRKTLYRWIEKGLISREKDKNLSFVSLAEVKAVCDRVTNQQDTENVTTGNTQDAQQDTIRVTEDTNTVTLKLEYYNGLITRLAGLEIERRYLLENKEGLEAREQELTETRAALTRANSELKRLLEVKKDADQKAVVLLDQQRALEARERELRELRAENERLKLPWYKKLFRSK
ncbi:MAG: helix-turn-helix domain-containing protein [bacterium]